MQIHAVCLHILQCYKVHIDIILNCCYVNCAHIKMCWSQALLTSWVLLLVQLLNVEAVPISLDKTKVKEPEKTAEEPPASVVRSPIFMPIHVFPM